jgi:hypothetical protein
LEKEPGRSINCPGNLSYERPDGRGYIPDQKIAGMILKRGGKVVRRFGMTNAHLQGLNYHLDEDGMLNLNGEIFYLKSL